MTTEIFLTDTGMDINTHVISEPLALCSYIRILGEPTRSLIIGKPAPYGHRDVVGHYYDKIGLMLREDHKSELISSIDIVFDVDKWHFKPLHAFDGRLTCHGVAMLQGMNRDEIEHALHPGYYKHMGHAMYRDVSDFSIQIEFSNSIISAVCVAF